jgi:anti-repressor protein
VAGEICGVLNILAPKDAVGRLDKDERGRFKIATRGGMQECSIINESGLYSLVLTSRKPEAKRLRSG